MDANSILVRRDLYVDNGIFPRPTLFDCIFEEDGKRMQVVPYSNVTDFMFIDPPNLVGFNIRFFDRAYRLLSKNSFALVMLVAIRR